MDRPTTAEFNHWIELCRTSAEDIFNECIPKYDGIIHRDHVIEFFARLVNRREDILIELAALPATRWINRCREIDRAKKIVQGRRRDRPALGGSTRSGIVRTPLPQPTLDELEAEVNRAADFWIENARAAAARYAQRPDGASRAFDQNTLLRSRLLHVSSRGFVLGEWFVETVSALAEYFEGGAAIRIIEARREVEELGAQLNPLLERLKRAYKKIESLQSKWPVEIVARRSLRIVDYAPVVVRPADQFPIKRADATADERLFVYRMYLANKREARKPKVEAIAELMGADGFRHQYNMRTVERLCAEFTGMKLDFRADPLPGHEAKPSGAIGTGAGEVVPQGL